LEDEFVRSIPAIAIGSKVHETLENSHILSVLGITSRGVFLVSMTGWVIFLSSEKYRGPLSMNILDADFSFLRAGDQASVENQAHRIALPGNGMVIDYSGAQLWRSGLRKNISDIEMKRAIERLLGLDDPLVSTIINRETECRSENQALEDELLTLTEALRREELEAAAKISKGALGKGSGLTPEGDDWFDLWFACSQYFKWDSAFNRAIFS
jgi:hypothetical protein